MPLSGLWIGAIGAEVEGWAADGRSDARLPGNDCGDCLRLDGALGAFGRVGWQGLATDRTQGGRGNNRWQGALVLGAGTQIPLSRQSYLRLDATWSRAGSADLET
jgi:hypothetical protein